MLSHELYVWEKLRELEGARPGLGVLTGTGTPRASVIGAAVLHIGHALCHVGQRLSGTAAADAQTLGADDLRASGAAGHSGPA